jgi:hypothetical protein
MSPRWTWRLAAVHAAATLYMAGLIWFVQVVHYPLLAAVGPTGFAAYEQSHRSRTALVVAPPMAIEGAAALMLFVLRPAGVPVWQLSAGAGLLAVVWASTAFVQVPCHEALSQGFDRVVHERLVATNWLRTAAWTLRAVLALAILRRVAG